VPHRDPREIPREELESLVEDIQDVLWRGKDGKWDSNKHVGLRELEEVACLMGTRGLYPGKDVPRVSPTDLVYIIADLMTNAPGEMERILGNWRAEKAGNRLILYVDGELEFEIVVVRGSENSPILSENQ
jgi:hypothetical protein